MVTNQYQERGSPISSRLSCIPWEMALVVLLEPSVAKHCQQVSFSTAVFLYNIVTIPSQKLPLNFFLLPFGVTRGRYGH